MYDVHLLCSGALRLNLDSSKVQDDFIALGTSRLHLYAVFCSNDVSFTCLFTCVMWSVWVFSTGEVPVMNTCWLSTCHCQVPKSRMQSENNKVNHAYAVDAIPSMHDVLDVTVTAHWDHL